MIKVQATSCLETSGFVEQTVQQSRRVLYSYLKVPLQFFYKELALHVEIWLLSYFPERHFQYSPCYNLCCCGFMTVHGLIKSVDSSIFFESASLAFPVILPDMENIDSY